MTDQANIHKKVYSKNEIERLYAMEMLEMLFKHCPDKDQAWEDLIELMAFWRKCLIF